MHNTKSSKSSKKGKYVEDLQRRDEQKMIANQRSNTFSTTPSTYFLNFQPVYTNRPSERPCGTSLLDHFN